MLSSQVDSERCQRIKRRVYLSDVDEFNASSYALTGEALDSVLSVSSARSKVLKEGYVADLTRTGGISPCSLMLGLLYIDRLSKLNSCYVKSISSRDLFLISMMVASKYMNDEGEKEALTNSDWAEIGSKPKSALDEMELNFLQAIDWRLYVPLEEYYTFVTGIEGKIALKQATARGWLTYSDLDAIWEATNLQDTMLTASKQAAKVAVGSSCVYLVCLATLFATSRSMQMASTPGNGLSPSHASSMDAGSLLPEIDGQYLYTDMAGTVNVSSPWIWLTAAEDTGHQLEGQAGPERNGEGVLSQRLLLEDWRRDLLKPGLWSEAGTFGGKTCKAGDSFCEADGKSSNGEWISGLAEETARRGTDCPVCCCGTACFSGTDCSKERNHSNVWPLEHTDLNTNGNSSITSRCTCEGDRGQVEETWTVGGAVLRLCGAEKYPYGWDPGWIVETFRALLAIA